MWKVKKIEDAGRIVLKVSGRLEGEQVNEVKKVFAVESATRNLILDLTDLRLVDQEAVRFLADCEAGGASLQNCPAYIREWITAGKVGALLGRYALSDMDK